MNLQVLKVYSLLALFYSTLIDPFKEPCKEPFGVYSLKKGVLVY